MSTSRSDGFFVAKSIDGQPKVNGSQLIWGMRLSHFMFRMFQRQTYYESVSTAAEAQRQFVNALARRERLVLPAHHSDGMLVVVEAFESWRSAPHGEIAFPRAGDKSIGLHVVDLTHYEKHGSVLGFWNSWGPQWGRNGHGTMPFEYMDKYFHEAFAVRRARWGPPIWNFKNPSGNPTLREERRLLTQEAPRERARRRMRPLENWAIEVYETSSPTTGRHVVCLEVQTGFGLRMAWMFLRDRLRPDGARICEIPELFVWPVFRRMGIGRYLEYEAVNYATSWGCAEINLMLNEGDSTIGPPRAAARKFANATGYEWRWTNDVAPRRTGTAVKRLPYGRADP